MTWQLHLKDLIYITVYLISFIGVMVTYRMRLTEVEREGRKEIALLKSVVFSDKGALNVVDQATCLARQDQAFRVIREKDEGQKLRIEAHEVILQKTCDKIDRMNENITQLITRMKIQDECVEK